MLEGWGPAGALPWATFLLRAPRSREAQIAGKYDAVNSARFFQKEKQVGPMADAPHHRGSGSDPDSDLDEDLDEDHQLEEDGDHGAGGSAGAAQGRAFPTPPSSNVFVCVRVRPLLAHEAAGAAKRCVDVGPAAPTPGHGDAHVAEAGCVHATDSLCVLAPCGLPWCR